MSFVDDIKVATAYFPIQSDDICMNEVGIEPTLLRIIKFQKYLQKFAINIPTNIEALVLLGTVISNADCKNFNNNQTWVAPTYPVTAPVLTMLSARGLLTISTLEKST